jgi:predicted DCC family thiol-disulfide oxidoreductase YuxK
MAPDLILFDGDCAFCNGWVRWIMKRDANKRFRFAPLGSPEGQGSLAKHQLPFTTESMVLLMQGQAFTRSDAAWRMLQLLPRFGFLSVLLRCVPRPLRNWGYDLVAKNRHRLGGKEVCELPAEHGR